MSVKIGEFAADNAAIYLPLNHVTGPSIARPTARTNPSKLVLAGGSSMIS